VSIDYRPPPTIKRFLNDDTSLVRALVGPIGSGKSMGCIIELLRRATQQAPDAHGKRNTRFSVIRNTSQQLRTTVLADVRQYLGPMMDYYTTDSTIRVRVPLPDGTTVVSDWLLIPLDTEEDQQRLLSMQLTGAWINELREVPIAIVDPLIGRLGRYPSRAMGGPTWHGLIADTNPWDTDSPYHDAFVLKPVPNWALYHQPSGIGPDAENTENLPANYYENLLGRGEEWALVHIESEWGTSNAGQAVFRRSFHAPTHVRDIQIVVNPLRPLIIGLDFGRTPTALIGQADNLGRLLIFKEVVTEDTGLIQMLEEHLKPVLTAEPFAGKRFFVVADPAGREKSQMTEESPFDVLRQRGFLAYPASTNKVANRLTAVEGILRRQIGGEPALQISREGCPTLIRALGNKYRYKRRRDGRIEDLPEKLHPWSDVADACQYMVLGVNADVSGRVLLRDRPRTPPKPAPSALAWT
jgi:hypothetical protein